MYDLRLERGFLGFAINFGIDSFIVRFCIDLLSI